MIVKSKFKLFSFIIHKSLIFYTSTNKKNRIFGFSIIKTIHLNKTIEILRDFLSKGLLDYFSIQILINKNLNRVIFLSFQDREEKTILKIFNLITLELKKKITDIKILKSKKLEEAFLRLGFPGDDPDLLISSNSNTIILNQNNNTINLHFYEIKFKENLEKCFFRELENFLQNIKIKAIIIVNFIHNFKESLMFNAYLIYISENKPTVNVKKEINKFFNTNILNEIETKISFYARLLWRKHISKKLYNYELKSNYLLYQAHNKVDLQHKIVLRILNKLDESKLSYLKLNHYIYLIERKILLMIVLGINLNDTTKIIKKFYNKYDITLLIKKSETYNKISKVTKINKLKNLKIHKIEDFVNKNNIDLLN
ncbi:MAG: hypothetical protein P8Y97_06785 [Candidatus Lokiarchaeota archaeon]